MADDDPTVTEDDDPIIDDPDDPTVTYGPIGVTETFADGSIAWFSPYFDGETQIRVNIDPGGGIEVTITDFVANTSSVLFSVGYSGPPGQPDGGPPHTGNMGMPAVDGDGNVSDTGMHPKLWGGGDTKDPWDISDTGTVFKVLGHDDGPVDDPWDRTDATRRVRLPGGDIVAVEPWDKVGPKFRPIFQLLGSGERVTGYGFNRTALVRFIGAIVALTSGMQVNDRG